MFDLRSDTITLPTAEMRKAMAEAEVGDDVYHEDVSINTLERMASEMVGKEDAIFVPSGSMGNLIALYINGGRGKEVLCDSNSHIIQHEVGSIASIAGTLSIGVPTPKGILQASMLAPLIKEKSYDLAQTALIEVENTIGGICYPLSTLVEIKALATKHNMLVHMDGARFFNAVVATKEDPIEIGDQTDTLTFCISKGLGAPVGSLLCGSSPFIEEARVVRKMLGGGMRQAGILAAGGIYALTHNISQLEIDHQRAKEIASSLQKTTWALFDIKDVQTNIIFFGVKGVSGKTIEKVFGNHNIACFGGNDTVRLVTNLNLSDEDVKGICKAIESIDEKEFYA
ncbi:MAG: low specificity L-threonine aldolase [Spirochaetia bacterium]|nr:low specificity L-threonine aldolase [Spirochaetia bacterium]